MAYRQIERKPHPKRRDVSGLVTPGRMFVHNGATVNFAFPCFYVEALPPKPHIHHRRDVHDHFGWPNPQHPDCSCQAWDFPQSVPGRRGWCKDYIDMGSLVPINLLEEYGDDLTMLAEVEGYSESEVYVSPYIDNDEPHVIRLWVNSNIPSLTHPEHVKFAIYIMDGDARVLALLQTLTVLPTIDFEV